MLGNSLSVTGSCKGRLGKGRLLGDEKIYARHTRWSRLHTKTVDVKTDTPTCFQVHPLFPSSSLLDPGIAHSLKVMSRARAVQLRTLA